ncbi:tetratricopeptide repeat-containing sensor histidine kinase [Myroides guanonis]|uniref:histidine kinase n=1 Tax=Myroides guanonis TaxID=1150112 RepID=A0A1I3LDC0_9FLAO|nr:tetratricopeptide repeat protein [Myroides guanonis]SFI82540.1 Histidine kinase-, DNA gyrase B-, and HSP90-like ATPase [Myroides guanonis]
MNIICSTNDLVRFLFVFLGFLFSIELYPSTAQQLLISKTIDFSFKKIPDKKFDSITEVIGNYADDLQYEKAIVLSDSIFESLNDNSSKQLAKLYHLKGYVYHRKGDLFNAIAMYEKAVEIRNNIKDKEVVITYLNLGKSYYDIGDYVRSIQEYEKGLQLSKKYRDISNIGSSLSGIGVVLSDQGKRQEALNFFKESLSNDKKIKDSVNISRSYYDIGEIKYLVREMDSAKIYFEMANEIALMQKDEYLQSYCVTRMGTLEVMKGNYSSAEKYLLQGLEIRNRLQYPIEIIFTKVELAKLYVKIGELNKAERLLLEVLKDSKSTPFLKGEYMANELLSELNEKEGNYLDALKYHKEFSVIGDSLKFNKNNSEIENAYTRLQIEKHTQEVVFKQKQQRQIYLSLLLFVSCSAIGGTGYLIKLRKGTKRKYEYKIRQKELEVEKQILLQLDEERRRISRDVHDDLGSSISGIKLLSEIIYKKTKDEELKKEHERLLSMQLETSQKIRDIIWVLNNDNNSIESLAWYCHNYAESMLKSFSINLDSYVDEDMPPINIDNESRKSFFLCVKEAINNILKHSKGDNVFLSISFIENEFKICIQDNGKGMEKSLRTEQGFGLKNMKKRMDLINGVFNLETNLTGTKVCFSKKYPK